VKDYNDTKMLSDYVIGSPRFDGGKRVSMEEFLGAAFPFVVLFERWEGSGKGFQMGLSISMIKTTLCKIPWRPR
jgi:hypothetical protein